MSSWASPGQIITSLTPALISNLGQGIKITLPPQTATDALDSYLKNMLQLAPLVFILLTMGCVADERGKGTAVTVLTKPVPRGIFVLAKFCAYELTLALSVILAAAGAYYYTSQLFSTLPFGGFLIVNLALFILMSASLAFTVLASVFFRNAVAAGGLAFVGYLALLLLPDLNATITQALPSVLFNSDRITQLLAGTAALVDTLKPLLIGAGLAAIFVALACVVFRAQEL